MGGGCRYRRVKRFPELTRWLFLVFSFASAQDVVIETSSVSNGQRKAKKKLKDYVILAMSGSESSGRKWDNVSRDVDQYMIGEFCSD